MATNAGASHQPARLAARSRRPNAPLLALQAMGQEQMFHHLARSRRLLCVRLRLLPPPNQAAVKFYN
jgi:hypothetical protein